MAAHGLSIDWYVHRHRDRDEVLPWAHISAGLHEDFLWQDWEDALAQSGTPDCRWTPCYDCGACTGYGLEHVVASTTPPAGGSQGTGQDLSRGHEVPVQLRPVARGGSPAVTRVRIRFVKLGKIRWTSHRDVARMWERAFRRVQLPVAYSAGYSPRPKVSFGLALPTGHESVAEYLDVELVDPTGAAGLDVRTLPGRLSAALPIGVDATAAEVIAPGTPSLQEDVTSCTWRWAAAPEEGTDPLGSEELAARVAAVLAASSVVVTRTRKGEEHTDDIRAGIYNLKLLGPVGPDLRRACGWRPNWPAGLAPFDRRRCSSPWTPVWRSARCGGRINGFCATAPGGNRCWRRIRSARRPRRTPWGVRHEKGTSSCPTLRRPAREYPGQVVQMAIPPVRFRILQTGLIPVLHRTRWPVPVHPPRPARPKVAATVRRPPTWTAPRVLSRSAGAGGAREVDAAATGPDRSPWRPAPPRPAAPRPVMS